MRSGWHVFFGIVTIAVTAGFLAPSAFGLYAGTQWGGMYTDGWCMATVHVMTMGTGDVSPREESLRAPETRPVWSSPMHTEESCIRWAQSRCGKRLEGNVRVARSFPYYRGQWPLDHRDACDLPPPSPPWFER